MSETIVRGAGLDDHVLCDTAGQPVSDHERWAGYWREMRQHSITLIGDAFDDVARRFDARDTRAAVELVMFASDEDKSAKGIADAIYALLRRSMTEHSIANDYEDGVPIEALKGWVS